MRSTLIVASLTLALPALAQTAPTAEEINKVMDYYKNGQDQGPILLEAVLCGKVDRKTKECQDPVGQSVAAKSKVELKMRWFVPKEGKYDDIRIEWAHNGEIRRTSDLKLSGSMNYRTWKAKTLSKVGDWEVRIRRGDKMIKTLKVSATE